VPQFSEDVPATRCNGKVILALDQNPNTFKAMLRDGGVGGFAGDLLLSDKDGHLRVGVSSNNAHLNMWRRPLPGEELMPVLSHVLQLHDLSWPNSGLGACVHKEEQILGQTNDYRWSSRRQAHTLGGMRLPSIDNRSVFNCGVSR
jgi:hypothetical protein